MGPAIACDGPRGTVWPSNGGYGVLGQLVADVTGMPYAEAVTQLVLDPLGMLDSRFPARAADIARDQDHGGAVTVYTVAADGALEPFPAQVSTLPAVAGLWSTGADLVRLGTGWPSLLPAALAREAVTPQAGPGPGGLRVGLGLLLDDGPAAHGGAGFEAVAIAATIAVILVPGIVAVLPPPWNGRLGRFTLLEAAQQVSVLHPAAGLFSPGWSLLVLLAWPAAALAVAAVLITQRDA